jgi:hypothetical protein
MGQIGIFALILLISSKFAARKSTDKCLISLEMAVERQLRLQIPGTAGIIRELAGKTGY